MTLKELIEQAQQWQDDNPDVDVMEFDLIIDDIEYYSAFQNAMFCREEMEINLT